jgi:hypothetical protein
MYFSGGGETDRGRVNARAAHGLAQVGSARGGVDNLQIGAQRPSGRFREDLLPRAGQITEQAARFPAFDALCPPPG